MSTTGEMTTDLIVIIKATIREFNGLEEIIAEMVEAVRAHDPATRQYSFSIDEEKKTLFVMERYRDAGAFFAHTQTMRQFASRYFEKIEVVDASVHMAPGVELPNELREALAAFGTNFMTLVESFESLQGPVSQ